MTNLRILGLNLQKFEKSQKNQENLQKLWKCTKITTTTPRDYYKTTTNADLLQPGLGSLQPNLEDMEFDLDWLNSCNNGGTNSYTVLTGGISNGKSIKNSLVSNGVDSKPLDLLSAVVTATTATPVLSSQQPQPEQPFDPPTRTSPMMVTATASQPSIATTRHSGLFCLFSAHFKPIMTIFHVSGRNSLISI